MELEYDETIELLLLLGTQKLFKKMRKEAKRLYRYRKIKAE